MDGICVLVWDLDAELLRPLSTFAVLIKHGIGTTNLLDGHNHLDRVQAVKSKVVGEMGGRRELVKVSKTVVYRDKERFGVAQQVPLMSR